MKDIDIQERTICWNVGESKNYYDFLKDKKNFKRKTKI